MPLALHQWPPLFIPLLQPYHLASTACPMGAVEILTSRGIRDSSSLPYPAHSVSSFVLQRSASTVATPVQQPPPRWARTTSTSLTSLAPHAHTDKVVVEVDLGGVRDLSTTGIQSLTRHRSGSAGNKWVTNAPLGTSFREISHYLPITFNSTARSLHYRLNESSRSASATILEWARSWPPATSSANLHDHEGSSRSTSTGHPEQARPSPLLTSPTELELRWAGSMSHRSEFPPLPCPRAEKGSSERYGMWPYDLFFWLGCHVGIMCASRSEIT